MSYADLTAADWMARSDEQATRIAEEIADRHDLRLVEVRGHRYAGRDHRLAIFDRAGLAFALVPAGEAVLGYDGSRFNPTPEQAADFADSAEEYELPPLAEYLDEMTSPVRRVQVPAMLVTIEPYEPCASDIEPDDPRVLDLVASMGDRRGGGISTHDSGGGLEVRFDADGRVVMARERSDVSYDEAVARVAAAGLRLSTPDEWEYACGAGAQTLFRWGDQTADDYGPYESVIGLHREPNLWGLAIGQDPYQHESTSDRTIVCGGDGGEATCGGYGFFVAWVSIATAYRNAEFGEWLDGDDGFVDQIFVRPVIDLS